jgi:4-hydroxy-3-methylbut-2-enyl diphosphate reductase
LFFVPLPNNEKKKMNIEIEKEAGFCFGVVSAINALEKELKKEKTMYCIGDIVHNNMEVERLERMGLRTIDLSEFSHLKDTKVMIRAHGEPPSTYNIAKENNINIIDATCPIVLKLQKDVKKGYMEMKSKGGQIVIFGKKGHAEVVGLEGQTDNTAIVVSNEQDLSKIDYTRPIHIYSQTTKNKEDYQYIIEKINQKRKELKIDDRVEFLITDSICKKVSMRAEKIVSFAKSKDCVLFVSGKHSSNGTYLYNLCKKNNQNTFFISSEQDIDIENIRQFNNIGISGATSTPMWLMKKIKDYVYQKLETN